VTKLLRNSRNIFRLAHLMVSCVSVQIILLQAFAAQQGLELKQKLTLAMQSRVAFSQFSENIEDISPFFNDRKQCYLILECLGHGVVNVRVDGRVDVAHGVAHHHAMGQGSCWG
jgi:hypothetical protein